MFIFKVAVCRIDLLSNEKKIDVLLVEKVQIVKIKFVKMFCTYECKKWTLHFVITLKCKSFGKINSLKKYGDKPYVVNAKHTQIK